jgi:cell division protein FtsB
MKKYFSFFINKYIVAAAFLIVWVLFFDETNFLNQQDKLEELSVLQKKRAYFVKEIAIAKQELNDIKDNPESVEKFARENYFMKKNGEDIFIIENPQP